jgi:YD repeat-containing protein
MLSPLMPLLWLTRSTSSSRRLIWRPIFCRYGRLESPLFTPKSFGSRKVPSVRRPRQMPGGTVITQTRAFNYLAANTITAYLQSATNPENGTVFYTYNADGSLASKTDAKNQTLSTSATPTAA